MLHGTWKVTGGGSPDIPVVPAAAAVMAVAIASWLATVLLILAIVFVVLAVLLVVAAVMTRRRYPDYSPEVAEQADAYRAELAATKAKPAVVEHHHYVHTLPGATAGEASWVPLVRGTVEPERKRDQ